MGKKYYNNNVKYDGIRGGLGRKYDYDLVERTYLSGLTIKQTAEELDMPWTTVKGILQRMGTKKRPGGRMPKGGWNSQDIIDDIDKYDDENLGAWIKRRNMEKYEDLIRTRVRKYVQVALGADMSAATYIELYKKDKLRLKGLMESEEWKARREAQRGRAKNQHTARKELEIALAKQDADLRRMAKNGTIRAREESATFTKESFLEELERKGHVKIGGI